LFTSHLFINAVFLEI